jgi:hypothetical protein
MLDVQEGYNKLLNTMLADDEAEALVMSLAVARGARGFTEQEAGKLVVMGKAGPARQGMH